MKPVTTEKAVMIIEKQNTLTFELERKITKTEIKKEIEEIFNIKVDKVNTFLRGNKKYAYVKLNKKYPAMDVATKLGLI